MPRAGVKPAGGRAPRRVDPLSAAERSARMSRVRSKANRSTEVRVAAGLTAAGIRGWTSNAPGVTGSPDFYFAEARLALFVDGCFWHGCPTCNRRIPRARRAFWRDKIAANRRRDRRVSRQLRADGHRVYRVWEHSLRDEGWLVRVRRAIQGPTPAASPRPEVPRPRGPRRSDQA
jgi:DNA mismatch endonuclease, patch repair protein